MGEAFFSSTRANTDKSARSMHMGRSAMPSPSQRFGAAKEALAERVLSTAGYTVVDRNWRGGGGEIDRIAWDGDTLCFVEVRARGRIDFGTPAETVDRRKQRRIVRAARAYLMAFAVWPMVRFDVVSVVVADEGEDEIELVKNAFDAGR